MSLARFAAAGSPKFSTGYGLADPPQAAAKRMMDVMPADKVWKPSVSVRLFSLLPILGLVALSVWLTIAVFVAEWEDSAWYAVGVFPMLLGPAILLWRLNLTPRIRETDDGLHIRNAFSSVHVPWIEVEGCEPSYWGIVISRTRKKAVLARAVQKWNIATWLNRRTKADEACDYFMKRSEAALRTATR